jgi:hypothetical protein
MRRRLLRRNKVSENVNVENGVINADVEKPGWELGQASEGKLPGHGGTDLASFARHNAGWTPGKAGASLAHGAGGLGKEGDFEAARKITESLLAAAEKERLMQEAGREVNVSVRHQTAWNPAGPNPPENPVAQSKGWEPGKATGDEFIKRSA